jgi:hypothetical protein
MSGHVPPFVQCRQVLEPKDVGGVGGQFRLQVEAEKIEVPGVVSALGLP